MSLLDQLFKALFKQAKKSARKQVKSTFASKPRARQPERRPLPPVVIPPPIYLPSPPRHSFVVVDRGTTGRRPEMNSIVEIGALRVDQDGNVIDQWQTLLRTPNPLSRKIIELTGITQDMVDRHGVDPKKALAAFTAFAGGSPMVAYNAPFDARFLYGANARHGLDFAAPFYCALKASRKAFTGLPGYKLGEVAAHCGLDTSGAHRALADCQMTHQVYMAALRSL